MNAISFDVEAYKKDMIKIMNPSSKEELAKFMKQFPNSKFSPINRSWIIPTKDISKLIKEIKNVDQNTKDQIEKIVRLPMPHQEEARDFLVENKKAILSDEQGLGKTYSSILAGNEVEGKKLAVVPSGLRRNWQREISYTTNVDITVIKDGSNWISPSSNGWTIVSYDVLEMHMDTVLDEGYSCVIFDEVHYCRAINSEGEARSRRARAFLKVSSQVEYVFALTGTPIVNGNKDVFNLLSAVNHYLSFSWFDYSRKYCQSLDGSRGRFNGSLNEEDLYIALGHKMLRRLKDHVVNLPEKKRLFTPVNIDLAEYKDKIDEHMMAKDVDEDNGKHLVFLNAMRTLIAKEKCNHTISLADKLVNDGEQVVIFTNYDSVVKAIEKHYGEDCVRVTGKDSVNKRQKAVDAFQSGEKKIIVCNIIAGGVGITLTSARHLIFNDMSWLPAEHLQCEDRIHRISQTRESFIHYLYVEDTIDEKMMGILERRFSSISKSLNGVQETLIGDLLSV